MADQVLIVGLLVAIVVVAVTLLFLSRRQPSPTQQAEPAAGQGAAEATEVLRKKARQHARPGRAGAHTHTPAREEEEGEGEDGMLEDGEIPEYDKYGKKIGTKKREKLIAKEEKRARNEQIKAEREDEKERQRLREEEVKKEEARKAEAEQKEKEDELKRIEEEKKKEQEEYDRLKASFMVEDDGSADLVSGEETQGLLGEFVAYIKAQKVVLVEELAVHFKLKASEAVNRLQSLEQMGHITGVMDDRGKFIYISEEEMNAVCKFIRQRGRVSISELAENSNSLIRLQGEAPPTAASS